MYHPPPTKSNVGWGSQQHLGWEMYPPSEILFSIWTMLDPGGMHPHPQQNFFPSIFWLKQHWTMLDRWVKAKKSLLIFGSKQHWPALDIGQWTISTMLWSKQNRNCRTQLIVNRFSWNCPNRGHFSEAVEMSTISPMLWSKLNKNLCISVHSEKIFTKLSEQGSFFQGCWNEYNK